MPACLTHYTFAKENIPEDKKDFSDIYFLATQGSDPFFYYGILPFWSGKDKKEIQEVGERVHHEEIGIYYSKMLEYALGKDRPTKEMLLAYLDGLWMHYCVDRNVHPYVFYRSGFDEEGKLKGYCKFSHGRFEAVLDAFLAREKGTYRKTSKTIKVKEEDLKEISTMWFSLKEYFPILKEDSYLRAVKAYKGVEGVLWTRTGLKRILFRLVGKHSLAYGMSYPKFYRRYDYVDVTNSSHSLWRDPITGESRDDSLADLFEKSKKDYAKVHALLYGQAKDGVIHSQPFVAFVARLDHDGASYGMKMRYNEICWKDYEK